MSTKLIDRGWNKIYRNMMTVANKSVAVGILGDVPYASFHEFGTSKMVPRPFMRQTFETKSGDIENVIADQFSKVLAGASADIALKLVGLTYQGYIKQTIRNGNFARLKDSTWKAKLRKTRKGGSTRSPRPLIETSRMIGAVDYEIR